MNHPKGVTVDDRGNIYIADTMNMVIRKISDAGKSLDVQGIILVKEWPLSSVIMVFKLCNGKKNLYHQQEQACRAILIKFSFLQGSRQLLVENGAEEVVMLMVQVKMQSFLVILMWYILAVAALFWL